MNKQKIDKLYIDLQQAKVTNLLASYLTSYLSDDISSCEKIEIKINVFKEDAINNNYDLNTNISGSFNGKPFIKEF